MVRLVPSPVSNSQKYLAAIGLLSLLLVVARFDEFVVGSMADDAVYAELARSIGEGRGPVLHVGPDEHSVTPITQPSGYPLLISPVAYLFPYSLTALKLCSALFFFLLLFVLHLLLKPATEPYERLALLALVALNPWAIAYANRIFSEAAYTLVSLTAVLLYDRWLRGQKLLDFNFAAMALCLSLGGAIRSIGFALPLAVVLHLAYRRQWRRIGVWIPCQAAFASLFASFAQSSGGAVVPESYLSQIVGVEHALFDRLAFMAWTLFYYLHEIAALTLPLFGETAQVMAQQQGLDSLYAFVAWTLGAGLLLLSLSGILHRRWRGEHGLQLLYIYQLIFLGVLCNWTFIPVDRPGGWVELRLLLPLLPSFYLFALGGLQALAARFSAIGLIAARGPLLLLTLALPMSLIHNAYRIKVPFREALRASGRGFIDFSAGSQYIKEHTGPRDIIMASNPLERHIHHNRAIVGYGDFGTLDEQRANYVFIGPSDPNAPNILDPASEHALAAARAHPDRFELVRADAAQNWMIFRVIGGDKNRQYH